MAEKISLRSLNNKALRSAPSIDVDDIKINADLKELDHRFQKLHQEIFSEYECDDCLKDEYLRRACE